MGSDVTVSFTEKGTVGIRFAEDTFTGCVVVVDIVGNSQASKHKEVQGGLVLRRVGKTDVVGAPYRDVITAIQAQPERPLMMSFSGVGLSKEQVRACNVSEFPNHARLIFTCACCVGACVCSMCVSSRAPVSITGAGSND